MAIIIAKKKIAIHKTSNLKGNATNVCNAQLEVQVQCISRLGSFYAMMGVGDFSPASGDLLAFFFFYILWLVDSLP